MNFEWVWAIGAGAVVTAAGFWCSRMVDSVERANAILGDMAKSLSSLEAKMGALHSRVDRVEEFIDKFAERRAAR